ncbi:formylglycine-generating enzyme family protein [Lysobacter soyae]|nr:formylglycine-generating enzyme family protein [Lysobacter sp. CJ11]
MLILPALCAGSAPTRYAMIPGAVFKSALKYEDATRIKVAPFKLMRTPVTNADFLSFVKAHPNWQRGKAPVVFAEKRYLAHWQGATALGPKARPDQPVVNVSWFAADAYCKAQGARLPDWREWELVAAADETRTDARKDPVWRERILRWYSRPSNTALMRVGLQSPNAYGVSDMHGLIWEWTGDYASLLVDADNRKQGDADKAKFCGAAALSMNDRENYAVLMRIAMLSSLSASDVTVNLGFRCAQ